MKVSIDTSKCQGHARCWEIAPEVFDLDDEGYGTVLLDEVPDGLKAKALDAVQNCPERAITAQ